VTQNHPREAALNTVGHSGKYLYPVHQMSDTFKSKFLNSLKRALRKQNELAHFDDKVQAAYKSRWVVYCELSMAGYPLIPNHQYVLSPRGKRERYVL
jgi:adenine-specific DNA methylase